jgi:voltage-gated potassium channel
VVDNAVREETLVEAGIERAKAIITTLSSDPDNIMISLTARELNPDIVIVARASEDSSERKLYMAGASKVVKPHALGGIHLAHLVTKPYVVKFLETITGVSDENFSLEEFKFKELKDEYKNKTISDLDIRQNTGATVIGISDPIEGFIFNPGVDTKIADGDVLIVFGTGESINKFHMYCK